MGSACQACQSRMGSPMFINTHSPAAPRQLVKSPIRHGANVGMNRNLDFPFLPRGIAAFKSPSIPQAGSELTSWAADRF